MNRDLGEGGLVGSPVRGSQRLRRPKRVPRENKPGLLSRERVCDFIPASFGSPRSSMSPNAIGDSLPRVFA